VHVADIKLIPGKSAIGICNGCLAIADRFDLRAGELDAGSDLLNEMVFEGGPFIPYADRSLHLFLFRFQHHTDIMFRIQVSGRELFKVIYGDCIDPVLKGIH